MGGLFETKRHIDSLSQERRAAYLDQQPSSSFLGEKGYMEYFANSRGTQLCSYFWPAEGRPRGVVLLIHGQGSYLTFEYLEPQGVGKPKKYAGSWVEILNKAGFSVCGLDSCGFGRSGGLFGYIDSYRYWVQDVLQFTQQVKQPDRACFAGSPVFLLGGSLGGNQALHAALRQPGLYTGVVVLAPMISVEKVKKTGANRYLMFLASLLNWVIPTWPIVATNPNTMFPLLQQDWNENFCTYSYPLRVRIGVECIAACDDMCRDMHQLQLPLLAVHSMKDTMTDPEGSKQLCSQAKSTDKTLKLVNNMWHTLVKEEGNKELLQEIIQWMDVRARKAATAS